MSATFALIVGVIAGALAHFVGRGDGLGLASIVLVAIGVAVGWALVGVLVR